MKLNKHYLSAIAVLATVILICVSKLVPSRTGDYAKQAATNSAAGPEGSLAATKAASSNSTPDKLPSKLIGSPRQLPAQSTNAPDAAYLDYLQTFTTEMRADPTWMFKRPINFYGKAIDEKDKPLQGAKVAFRWNKLTATGGLETGRAETTTDSEGKFSLENEKSEGLGVEISKSGYYALASNQRSFNYSQPSGLHKPDPTSPVVFRLRKKGSGVDLVTSQNGIKSSLYVQLPLNGTPSKVDLLQKSQGADGPLVLTQIKPDPKLWKQASSWSFEMTILEGGFIQYRDIEFPYEAPEAGYQPKVMFNFEKGQTNWTESFQTDYFIRFGSPPVYGRLHVETSITLDGARLTYFINPDGSRNLEPK